MDVKPGYKKTEVGAIPEEWEALQITDFCDFIVPGRNKPKEFLGDIPWVTTPDLESGKTVSRSRLGLMVTRDEAKRVGSRVVPMGATIMTCVGELGIVARTGCDIVINQQLHAFIPRAKVDSVFLTYSVEEKKSYLETLATKTAVPYINKDNCNSIQVALPPLPEQRTIAAALSDVDALIAQLDRLIAKKRNLKHAAMQRLLTGKTRLPGFNVEWELGVLGDVVLRQRFAIVDGPFGSQMRIDDFLDVGIPVIEMEDLQDGPIVIEKPRCISVEHFSELVRSAVKPGDIVISKTGSLGYLGVVPSELGDAIITSRLAKISLDPSRCTREFAFQVLLDRRRTKYWEKVSQGGTMQILGIAMLKNCPLLLPSIEEQSAIAEILSDMDAEIAALKARRNKTKAIKQGMMQELLTGRIRLV